MSDADDGGYARSPEPVRTSASDDDGASQGRWLQLAHGRLAALCEIRLVIVDINAKPGVTIDPSAPIREGRPGHKTDASNTGTGTTSDGGAGDEHADGGLEPSADDEKLADEFERSIGREPGTADEAAANAALGFGRTPIDYTWHHLEGGSSMMVVPTDLHRAVKHTGGTAAHQHQTGMKRYGK